MRVGERLINELLQKGVFSRIDFQDGIAKSKKETQKKFRSDLFDEFKRKVNEDILKSQSGAPGCMDIKFDPTTEKVDSITIN